MKDFEEHFNKHLRLTILEVLTAAPAYSANLKVLHSAIISLGFHVSFAKIEGQIDWLSDQDLVDVEHLHAVRVAVLTQRGLDVAAGNAVVTGVNRPGPKG